MLSTVLVDTGFLVALFDSSDELHDSAKDMLASLVRDRRTTLVSVWPTVVETCFFLDPRGKCALLRWIERGALRLRPIEIGDLAAINDVIARFAEHDVDLADATLVWLGQKIHRPGLHRLHAGSDVGVAGEKDHRQRIALAQQGSLQVETRRPAGSGLDLPGVPSQSDQTEFSPNMV